MASPFDWKKGESSFARDRRFAALGKNGLSMAEIGSLSVARRTKAAGGRNPGTIDGLARRKPRKAP